MKPRKPAGGIERWKTVLRSARKRAQHTFSELDARRLARQAQSFGAVTIPEIFSQDLRPLHASMNEELLGLAGRSAQVLQNRFAFLNHAESFGKDINWAGTARHAWYVELHSFDYALDLAMSYRIFGEDYYVRHLRYLIAHWIALNPPFAGIGWEARPMSRRLRNWILAAALARQGWEEEFSQVAGESLALQCLYLQREALQANVLPTILDTAITLLLASRLFNTSFAAGLQATALEILREAVEARLPEGSCCEPSPSARVRLAEALLECLLFVPNLGAETHRWLLEKLWQAVQSVEEVLLPGGTLPAFGDLAPPSPERLDDLFALAAVVLDAPWYKALSDEFGIFPYLLLGEEGKEHFDQLAPAVWKPSHSLASSAGLYRLMDPEGSALIVTANPEAPISEHQDYSSYELVSKGHRVVVDSGAFQPSGEAGSEYFRNPQAHNLLLIDGKAPQPRHSISHPAAEFFSTSDFDRLALPCHRLEAFDLLHTRMWFSLRNGAWLVLDRLAGNGSHRLSSLLHFYPTIKVTPKDERAIASSRAMTVTIVPFGGSQPRIIAGREKFLDPSGWYSPAWGVKYASSVLAFEWDYAGGPWIGGYLILCNVKLDASSVKVAVGRNNLTLTMVNRTLGLPLGPLRM